MRLKRAVAVKRRVPMTSRPDLSDLAADIFRTLDVEEAAVFMLRPVGRTRLKRCVEIIGPMERDAGQP
jgi:hypothetical protein